MRNLPERLRRAAMLDASLWVSALALVAGAAVARAIVFLAPATGDDWKKARALGIVSLSILAGHSKAAESIAYVLALAGALITSLIIWTVWAMRAGRRSSAVFSLVPSKTPRATHLELAIVALIAFGVFAHFWNGYAVSFSPWAVLGEEGEMLAWVNTVLRGGVLSRDVFCLYGPLSTWLVAALFSIFKPSLGLWRYWIFALNAPALIATYLLLRGTTRTKLASGAGTIVVAFLCIGPIPAMSWSLSRVGLGLAALAALTRALDRGTITWRICTGVLLAAALLYSQEVGIACGLAAVAVLLLQPNKRISTILWVALGAALVLVPLTIYLVMSNALHATIENMFLFPHIRMLGFGALPFWRLALDPELLRAYFAPGVLVVSGFLTATKLLRGLFDGRVLTEAALFIFGALLFGVALSRPDDPHCAFVAPPALVLLTGLFEEGYFAIRWGRFSRRALAGAALLFGIAVLISWSSIARQNFFSLFARPHGRVLSVPRGGAALVPDEFANDLENITRAIQSRTAPDESFWVFPNEALLYFLADRPQPTHFPAAIFAVTREQRQDLVSELERAKPRWAVLYLNTPQIDGIPNPVAIPEVFAYVNATYKIEETFGAFALLRRKR